jgi:hypothetical protein
LYTENYGGVIGIAKDGHPIYGPYNENGELWGCIDVDYCNGFFDKDLGYAYASTSFFPYTIGCWGPSPPKRYRLTCSQNSCTHKLNDGMYLSAIYGITAYLLTQLF